MLVNSVHWFNPMIYFVARQINEECEISCDLSVTKDMSENEKRGYMNTILYLLSSNRGKNIMLSTAMASDKKQIKRRFTMIRKATKKGKIISLVSIVAAVTILAVTVFASGVLRNETQGQEVLNSEITTFDVDESANNKTNVLISSVDGSQMRADTIMLISLDHMNKSLAVMSIPRDTLIITNQKDNKIFTLMAHDGNDQKIIDAVRNNLAIPVHYYARMNFEGLRNIVDILGGVEFEVPMRMLYEDPAQDLYIDLKKGRQLLDGAKAESLLRYRSGYSDGDLTRTKVQQDFIIELLKQKLNIKYLSKTSQLYQEISKNLITNYPLSKFAEDVKILNDMNFEDVKTFTMPGNSEIRNGLFYYVADTTELENLTEQYFIVK